MDTSIFGHALERLMAGVVDDTFWLAHLTELSACQLGALYVALRLVRRPAPSLFKSIAAELGLSERWLTSGRGSFRAPS